MKFVLAQLKEGQVKEVQADYVASKLDIEFIDFHYLSPVHMEGTVEKGVDVLTFRGQLTSEVEEMCGRCLATHKSSVSKFFDLYYEVKDKIEIDTIDDLRETLIIDHPLSILCSENCKGLCVQCGTNLNLKSCSCDKSSTSSPFAPLKEAWMKKKGGKK